MIGTGTVLYFIFIPDSSRKRSFECVFPPVNNLVSRGSPARIVCIPLQEFIIMTDNSGVPVGNRLSVPVRCRLEIVTVTDSKNPVTVKGCDAFFPVQFPRSDNDIVLACRLDGRTDGDAVFCLSAVISIVGVCPLIVTLYRNIVYLTLRIHSVRERRCHQRCQKCYRNASLQSFGG